MDGGIDAKDGRIIVMVSRFITLVVLTAVLCTATTRAKSKDGLSLMG